MDAAFLNRGERRKHFWGSIPYTVHMGGVCPQDLV